MPKYGLSTSSMTTTTTLDTTISIDANAAGELAEVVELIMTGAGLDAAADTQHTAQSNFCDFAATAGTTTAQTPELMNAASRAADVAGNVVYTAEPETINAVSQVMFGFNQRGGMRWAVPRGEGILCVGDSTESGLVWRNVSSAAGQIDSNMQWWE